MSGAGAGKGLLARCICIIAFGRDPHAVTAGATPEELEKRIAAELMGGSPALFLDNLNNTAFKSDLLASAITERPARVRLLGKSQMVPLNASAFVILTGNGLTVSEDLARRFITIEFDPRTEDPEARPFKTDIRAEVRERRTELLAALLTVWRWGISADVKPGRALGSFEQWCRWVRDPLLELGCEDPVERVSETKARDGRRQEVGDLFTLWWEKHGDQPVAVSQLDPWVQEVADPQGRGRQYLSARLEKLAGTRIAGFVLTRQVPIGKWGKATYALEKTAEDEDHRGHGGHRPETQAHEPANGTMHGPMTPMTPMPSLHPPAGRDGYECGSCTEVGACRTHQPRRGWRRPGSWRHRPHPHQLCSNFYLVTRSTSSMLLRPASDGWSPERLAALFRRAGRYRRVRRWLASDRSRETRFCLLRDRMAQP